MDVKKNMDKVTNGIKRRNEKQVYMRRHMGLIRATGTIIGGVIGTGIFLSPQGVAANMGSVGGILLMWTFCGIISTMGALSFTELGAMLPEAGGHYAFVYRAFGPLLAFSTVWTDVIMGSGALLCLLARAGGTYLLLMTDPVCAVSPMIINLFSIFAIICVAIMNVWSLEWATKTQTLFSCGKLVALIIIIITGIVKLASGSNAESFTPSKAFQDSKTDFGSIALAAYAGYFAYSGWTLPKAIILGMSIITIVYVMANIAYLSVMTPRGIVLSPAVALTFAERALNPALVFVSVCVALSAIGTVVTVLLMMSRQIFRVGRDGILPSCLGMLNVHRMTPVVTICLLTIISIIYHFVPNIQTLMGYTVLSTQLQALLVFCAFFYLRWKEPHLHRPIKIPVIIPAIVLVINTAFLILAIYRSPTVFGVGLGIYLTFLPAYLFNKYVAEKFNIVMDIMDMITIKIQSFFLVVPECRGD